MGIGAVLGKVAGPIIGGLFGASGQSSANKANLAIARENRAWQEKMSNTAYQRAAGDLEKAGLNRILALGSPASTPGGNVATMGNVGAAGVAGASEGQQMDIAAKIAKENVKNISASTYKMDKEALKTIIDTQKSAEEKLNITTARKLLETQIPGAEAEANFWKDLGSGGGTAKGMKFIIPLLRMIGGK